jgi:TPR repeat protein
VLLSEVRHRLGAAEAAVSAARAAAALEPGQSYYLMVLARVLWNTGAHEPARKVALGAVEVARTEDERRNIAEFVAFAERASSAAAKATTTAAASSVAGPATPASSQPVRAPSGAPVGTNFARRCIDGDVVACNTVRSGAEESCTSTKSLISCSLMGHIYGRGLGIPVDVGRGIALFQQNCDAGSFGDCHNAAALLLQRGAPADRPRAIQLLSRACDGGYAPACEAVKSQPR